MPGRVNYFKLPENTKMNVRILPSNTSFSTTFKMEEKDLKEVVKLFNEWNNQNQNGFISTNQMYSVVHMKNKYKFISSKE